MGARADPDDERGPRFQMQEFAGGGETAQVKSQVDSSAFAAKETGKSRGKGKDGEKGEGKGKGKDGGREKGARRGGGRDDDYGGEEKRAPVAGSSLAAFVKPTKDGKSQADVLAAFAEPEPQKPQWGASDDWDSGWDAGWSSGGWGSGYSGGGHRSKGGKG